MGDRSEPPRKVDLSKWAAAWERIRANQARAQDGPAPTPSILEQDRVEQELDQRIHEARTARLQAGLRSLNEWALRRPEGDHDIHTTLTMLARKAAELPDAVDRAGWAESNRQNVES